MPVFRDFCSTNRTAETGLLGSEGGHCPKLFSGGHIRSPVSSRALGECNAIRSRGFGPSELTFPSALETEFGAMSSSAEQTKTLDRPWPSPILDGYGAFECSEAYFLLRGADARQRKEKNIEPGGTSIAVARDCLYRRFALLSQNPPSRNRSVSSARVWTEAFRLSINRELIAG